ncbi:MAG: hypothetical protein GEU79_01585 [Acidimicrobiia bacterium]|nr:hypothetical protein [Acidimicrobiia bacterium]
MTSGEKGTSERTTGVDRRRFLQLGGLGVAGAVLAACGGSNGGTTTTLAPGTTAATGTTAAAASETTTAAGLQANLNSLVLGEWNPNYASQWGYQLADALGYMADYGIDTTDYQLSDEYVAGLLGGSLDIARGDTNVLMGSAFTSGEPITMMSLYRTSEWQIMGVREGIETPEDLVGGTITGGQLEGRNTVVLRNILRSLGLDPDEDMEFVAMTGASDARLQALLAGTVDAANLFPRHRAGLEGAGGHFMYEELEPAPQEGFAAMGPWLEENGDTASAWIAAELKARTWLLDPANKDEAYQLMIDRGFDIPQEFIDQYEVELEQFSPDGGFETSEMDDFVELLVEVGDLPEGIEWRDHFDPTYLWAAQDELGLPRRPDSI